MRFFRDRTVRILSIDGGGIRGLIPALILREIRDRLGTKGRFKSFAEHFDLIAGTSAGALVALGLVVPAVRRSSRADPPGRTNSPRVAGQEVLGNPAGGGLSNGPSLDADRPAEIDASTSAALGTNVRSADSAFVEPIEYDDKPAWDINDIVDLYVKRGAEIFPRRRFRSLRTVVQAFADKYESAGLETVLRDIFSDATINDALTNILVTSYDTERMEPFFFKKRPRRRGGEGDLNFYMRDAARASSAAPTFFEPALISPVPADGTRFCLIDGGVFANNPAMCAYVEARKIFPHAKRYVLISLSTGRTMSSFPYEEVRSWGFFEWIRPSNGTPLAMIMGTGQSEGVNHQLEKLPEVEFLRIDGELLPGHDAIDDASDENIRNLTMIGERMIRASSNKLDRICEEIG